MVRRLFLVESPRQDTVVAAARRIEQNELVNSWSDGTLHPDYLNAVQIPQNGMFFDRQRRNFTRPVGEVLDNSWRIDGDRGWHKTRLALAHLRHFG